MASSGITVSVKDNTMKITRDIAKNMRDAVTDVTLDAKRVASASAPHDTGYLEGNANHSIKVGSGYLEGEVSFRAVAKNGFNYAEWTHDSDYNLGEKSKRKSGGKSKYGGGTVPVGKGYLSNTIENSAEGYKEHLTKAFNKALH